MVRQTTKPKKKPIGRSERLAIVGGVLTIAFLGIVGMNTTPTIADLFFACVVKSDTAYSTDYSESKWRSLRRGMTAEQVASIMGEPFTKTLILTEKQERSIWSYSRSPGGISSWKRDVILANGKVEDFDGQFDVH